MTRKQMTLTELAERAEKATGPDRELDALIQRAIRKPVPSDKWTNGSERVPQKPRYFTASMDTAMSLVPEGYDPLIDYTGCDTHGGKKVVELYYGPEEREIVRGCATTGPLALVAAALRAREAK